MNPDTQRIAEEAASWLERLKTAGPTERAEYLQWLRASKLHVKEMLLATAWDRVLDDLERTQAAPDDVTRSTTSPKAPTAPCAKHPHEQRTTLTRWPWLLAFASTLVLWVVLSWDERYRTQLGEQRIIQLLDGSQAHLNTLTKLRVDFTTARRDIYLDKGQVTFDVRHEPARPFVVHAGAASIVAIGTRFDVFRSEASLRIAVVDGSVEVKNTHLHQYLASGDSLVVSTGERRRFRIPPEEVTAWQQQRLIFHDRTLLEIAAEFNRYNRTKLRVFDPMLQSRRYSGTFDTGDPNSFAAYVATDPVIEVVRTSSELQIHARVRND